MEATQVARREWDAVIVGTGAGGGAFGWALAAAGRRVLFLEMGCAAERGASVRGDYPEMLAAAVGGSLADRLKAGGRFPFPIEDHSSKNLKRFVPFIGSGEGGGTALYGMVLERFFPADFEPARHHGAAGDATLPARWPINYEDLVPYYDSAEQLFRVRGGEDPLRGGEKLVRLGEAPPLSPAGCELRDMFASSGLHPYALPLACEYVPGCKGCQGFLCDKGCKNDTARVFVGPAVSQHGACLLDDCEVVRIEADCERVTGLLCRHRGEEFRVRAGTYALAAGALATPALLLRSRSPDWPAGLANGSGLVGRNLMRHFIDLYAVFTRAQPNLDGNAKEFGCNDLYLSELGKLGALQSFGLLPPGRMIADDLHRQLRDEIHPMAAFGFALVKPLMRPILQRLFLRATIVATIVEDLPYADNRVLPPYDAQGGGIAIRYRVHPNEAARVKAMRGQMKKLLKGRRYLLIKQAENNERIAHVCGTCRFGDDPRTSVLDRDNRAHDVENLYAVDASFFPSSGGTNPALTIAANALRAADKLLGKLE